MKSNLNSNNNNYKYRNTNDEIHSIYFFAFAYYQRSHL